MNKKLIIVESPAKAVKINKLLDYKYDVVASFGHIRNLKGKNKGIKYESNFDTVFEIVNKKQVNILKEKSKNASEVIIGTDADREGEAIGWHIIEILNLKIEKTKRIIFNEITKEALENAIKNSIILNTNLINAQKSRQIIDYIVGFNISPILWKNIQPKLSAGRVQSSILKLIIDKEKELNEFNSKLYYKVNGIFNDNINSSLNKYITDSKKVDIFLKDLIKSKFSIYDKNISNTFKKPSAPYTTSSLLQDCINKYKFNSKIIMITLQKLYENGLITYHRTDSVSISKNIQGLIKNYILENFGKDYLKLKNYKTETKCAQEAHEAIRPVNITINNIDEHYNNFEKKIYNLIWKRTIASQMSNAKYDSISIKIKIDNKDEYFISNGNLCTFNGYLIIYNELNDDKKNFKILNSLNNGDEIIYSEIKAEGKYSINNTRYNEANLIKKMKDLGIGRPSTYSSTINTILDRGYVTIETKDGEKKKVDIKTLKNDNIQVEEKEIILQKEVSKIFPTNIGKITCEFLENNFGNILKYDYTSNMENSLDDIANGKKNWLGMLNNFYSNFKNQLEKVKTIKNDNNIRIIGIDNNNKKIIAKIGPYGPFVQSGEKSKGDVIKYASIPNHLSIDSINMEEAIELLSYPKNIGKYQGKNIIIKKGKYGPYIEWEKNTYSFIYKKDDMYSKTHAIESISVEKANFIKKNSYFKKKNIVLKK